MLVLNAASLDKLLLARWGLLFYFFRLLCFHPFLNRLVNGGKGKSPSKKFLLIRTSLPSFATSPHENEESKLAAAARQPRVAPGLAKGGTCSVGGNLKNGLNGLFFGITPSLNPLLHF